MTYSLEIKATIFLDQNKIFEALSIYEDIL